MLIGVDVMREISRYLRQEVNSRGFREWMVSAQLQSEIEAEDVAVRLLAEIDGLYAQCSDGYLAEQSMRKELAKLLLSGGSSSQFVHVEYSFLRPSFTNPLPTKIRSSETSSTTTALSDNPDITQELVTAA
jgi:hypothetical protein